MNEIRYIRIHGDNIVECERTLALISNSFEREPKLVSLSLYLPEYELQISDSKCLRIELLSGHGRWGIDITSILMKNGGVLHEGADSYITEVINGSETVLLAIEYCSALPAGNNAWQRNGRAYSSIMAGIPYLYFAEVGGVELDEDRNVKAPRFPNPIVPFSYLATTKKMSTFCIPVYKPHPSISPILFNHFKDIFGFNESLQIINGIISNKDISKTKDTLINKSLALVKLLAKSRRSVDTLRNGEWDNLLMANIPSRWLADNTKTLVWKKKTADKVRVSSTFKKLFEATTKLNCLTIGAKDLPICLIPDTKKVAFENLLNLLYPNTSIGFDKSKQLAVVWVTGFKPRGDDSRPDRGLAPLARMVLGNKTEILAVVFGPAKPITWTSFKKSPKQIAADNGLWQSIMNICDYVLVDSDTCNEKFFYKTNAKQTENPNRVSFPHIVQNVDFGEHDTDSAIHQIFSRKETMSIFESMCNPPGGDWSGISYFQNNGNEYRWTSLPRVSQIGGKRPDHIIQIVGKKNDIILSIESKRIGHDLENKIGVNLKTYINDLFKNAPTAYRSTKTKWRLYEKNSLIIRPYSIISIGAFLYVNGEELKTHIKRGELDMILAFEFGTKTTLHVLSGKNAAFLVDILKQISAQMNGFVIKVH